MAQAKNASGCNPTPSSQPTMASTSRESLESDSEVMSDVARVASLNLEAVLLQLSRVESDCLHLRGERRELRSSLRQALAERAAVLRTLRAALLTSEEEFSTLGQRSLLGDERASASVTMLREQAEAATEELDACREAQRHAQAEAAAALAAANAAVSAEERAVRELDEFRRSVAAAAEERAHAEAEEHARRESEVAHQARSAANREEQQRQQLAEMIQCSTVGEKSLVRLVSHLEEEVARLAPLAAAAAAAEERARAAETERENLRAEMRKGINGERQRVAAMMYQEALQTHTLEEQSKALDDLNVRLSEAQQVANANASAAAEAEGLRSQLDALAASRSEHVHSILALDEQLASEQLQRAQAEDLVQTLQVALTERAAREAEADSRARASEAELEGLKGAHGEVRAQLAKAVTQASSASDRLQNFEQHRAREASSNPSVGMQTEWVSMILPLPMPPASQKASGISSPARARSPGYFR